MKCVCGTGKHTNGAGCMWNRKREETQRREGTRKEQPEKVRRDLKKKIEREIKKSTSFFTH